MAAEESPPSGLGSFSSHGFLDGRDGKRFSDDTDVRFATTQALVDKTNNNNSGSSGGDNKNNNNKKKNNNNTLPSPQRQERGQQQKQQQKQRPNKVQTHAGNPEHAVHLHRQDRQRGDPGPGHPEHRQAQRRPALPERRRPERAVPLETAAVRRGGLFDAVGRHLSQRQQPAATTAAAGRTTVAARRRLQRVLRRGGLPPEPPERRPRIVDPRRLGGPRFGLQPRFDLRVGLLLGDGAGQAVPVQRGDGIRGPRRARGGHQRRPGLPEPATGGGDPRRPVAEGGVHRVAGTKQRGLSGRRQHRRRRQQRQRQQQRRKQQPKRGFCRNHHLRHPPRRRQHTHGMPLPEGRRRRHLRRDALRPPQAPDAGHFLGQPPERPAPHRRHRRRDAQAQVLQRGHPYPRGTHGRRPGLCLPAGTGLQEPGPLRADRRQVRAPRDSRRGTELRRARPEPRDARQRTQAERAPGKHAGAGTSGPLVHAPDGAPRDEQHLPAAPETGTKDEAGTTTTAAAAEQQRSKSERLVSTSTAIHRRQERSEDEAEANKHTKRATIQ
mmetsp:Transcript_102209/g.207967  ORF Transcript_102209/g.207967 Transcript_102209/m.207967 type:complete len:551 (-) Transcript_102209:123-1775(-)